MDSRGHTGYGVLRALPAYLINGLTVAAGVSGVRLLVGAAGGALAAQLAAGGAIGASLADQPGTAQRNARYVALASLFSAFAAAFVAVLRPHPGILGLGVALIGGLSALLLAWGPSAGPLSFAPVLTTIFALALPLDAASPAQAALWSAAGAICYLGWSLLTSRLLESRYRALAVAQALTASARQLCTRARVLESAAGVGTLRDWIVAEASLAEQFQVARDLAYAAPAGREHRRNALLLQYLADLRDHLLSSRLDLHLFDADQPGRAVLRQTAAALRALAPRLEDCARQVSGQRGGADTVRAAAETNWYAEVGLPEADPRRRLLQVIANRQRYMARDVERIVAIAHGADEEPRLTRAELLRFVSPHELRWQDVRNQLSLDAPILRHALRVACALGSAYYIARVLPWTSHPQWLVLSVAVVLRGNLEQTLARRNMRVAGTLLGCAVVVLLLALRVPLLVEAAFLLSVGIAHAYVNRRYWLAAVAATAMALLQAHLIDPAAPLPVAERAADTVLGALLAWGFSYVLPSWERRRVPGARTRALRALREYALETLSGAAQTQVAQRLARRRAYDVLAELGSILQRSAVEPRGVQVSAAELGAMLEAAQRFMAHLSMVRQTLTRRRNELDESALVPLLQHARETVQRDLDPDIPVAPPPPGGGVQALPAESPTHDVLPWLSRRLQLLGQEAAQIRAAADRL